MKVLLKTFEDVEFEGSYWVAVDKDALDAVYAIYSPLAQAMRSKDVRVVDVTMRVKMEGLEYQVLNLACDEVFTAEGWESISDDNHTCLLIGDAATFERCFSLALPAAYVEMEFYENMVSFYVDDGEGHYQDTWSYRPDRDIFVLKFIMEMPAPDETGAKASFDQAQ